MKPLEVLCTKVLPSEAERIRTLAKKAGMTTSSYIRHVMIEAAVKPTARRKAA